MRRFLSGLITSVVKALTTKITIQIGSNDVAEISDSRLELRYGGNLNNPVVIGADFLDYSMTDVTIKAGLVTFPVYGSAATPNGMFGIGAIAQSGNNILAIGGGLGTMDAATEINFHTVQNVGDASGGAQQEMKISYGVVNVKTTLELDNAPTAANHATRKDYVDTHINNAAVHRTINDSGTAATDLWSASKITTELAGKSDVGHNHNDLYYTETEVDVIVDAIYDEIDLGEVKVDTDDNDKDVLINKIQAGNAGITVTKDATGADNMLNISHFIFPATVNGISSTTRLMPCYVDTEKSNKILSVETFTQSWGANGIGTQNGAIAAADPGEIVLPFDATIVGISAFARRITVGDSDINLFINGSNTSGYLTIPQGSDSSAIDFTKNTNVSAGDRITIQFESALYGASYDVVVVIHFKWRSTS